MAVSLEGFRTGKWRALPCELEERLSSKEIGGLGAKDFSLFGRAIRLRWLWYEWKDREKPWIGMEIPAMKWIDNYLKLLLTYPQGKDRCQNFGIPGG